MKKLVWLWPQTPLTDQGLSHLESTLGVSLPQDFRLWLLEHNGATPEPSEVRLGGGAALVINAFISFSQDDRPNVLSVLDGLRGRLPTGLIPFAEDHAGNPLCFECSREGVASRVVLWDHEEADPKRAIIPVVQSFSGLTELLREDG